MDKFFTALFLFMGWVIIVCTIFLPYQAQVSFAAIGLATMLSVLILRDA